MGSGTMAMTLPDPTTQTPPCASNDRLRATCMSPSLVPATIRLWESCPTLLATAPLFRAKSLSRPCAMPAPSCATVALDHRDEGEIVLGEQRVPILLGLNLHLVMEEHDARNATRITLASQVDVGSSGSASTVRDIDRAISFCRIAIAVGERLIEQPA